MKRELETIRGARRHLDKLRQKLLRPTPRILDTGTADIAAAVKCLQTLESYLKSHQGPRLGMEQLLGSELKGLRRDLQQTVALLDSAGKFYQGWARLVSNHSDEEEVAYNAAGKTGPRSPAAAGKLVLHG